MLFFTTKTDQLTGYTCGFGSATEGGSGQSSGAVLSRSFPDLGSLIPILMPNETSNRS